MVRRHAATNLSKFIKEMPAAVVIEEMIPLFKHLAGDDQDSVRLLTVEILIAIAEAVPKDHTRRPAIDHLGFGGPVQKDDQRLAPT